MMLLAIDNLPAHVWSPETVQIIIASACLNFEIVLALLNRVDLFRFFVVAWAIHPNLISVEIGCVVLEPEGESVVGVRPLFLRAEELMHSKQDTLQFWVFVHVLEVHDFTISESSSDEFQRRRR
jgi:hypothetical protein